jgi:hypothetical protein
MNHFRGETCKKGTETCEEGACVPRFWQFGEQEFVFRVVFIGPQVFKTKAANDSDISLTSQPGPVYVWDS